MKKLMLHLIVLICLTLSTAQRPVDAVLEPEKTVRAIYFRPNDRKPLPDIDLNLATLLTQTQQSYAEVMEQQGFGSKTFQVETDDTGNESEPRRFAGLPFPSFSFNTTFWRGNL